MRTNVSYLAGLTWLALAFNTLSQGTAFTYQGRLSEGGAAVSGSYELKFTLYDSLNGGAVVAGPITNKSISLSNGLFAAQMDFGAAPFNGPARWLEIGVRTNGSAGGHTILAPRQLLTPAPSAIHALKASDIQPGANPVFTGVAAFAPPGGPPFAVGSTITVPNLSADLFDGQDSTAFWKLNGNPGAPAGPRLLSTFDNEPLELHVGNQRALRLEPNLTSPSIVAGFPGNVMGGGVAGGVIAGGGSPAAPNNVFGNYCAVPGGQGNTANGDCATAIGFRSTANGLAATAIGWQAIANGTAAASIGDNTVAHDNSFAAGTRAQATEPGCFVWADTQFGNFTATAANQFLIRAANGVGINTASPGAMLQVGDAQTLNSQGMIRLASHSGTGPATRWWDIGVPEGDENVSGKFYSFVIDDPQLGTEPELTVRWDSGNVGIGTINPSSRLHAIASAGNGVQGNSIDANGVQGNSSSLGASGVYGENLSGGGYGVAGRTTGAGNAVFGDNPNLNGYAGYFNGNVHVTGTLTPPSDRNVKCDFASVDAREVLEKVASLPVQSWSYTNSPSVRHLGPVAQDFKAAFGLGFTDTAIATVDADGVALAAIQGLNQKVEEQKSELQTKEARIQALERKLARLEALLHRTEERE